MEDVHIDQSLRTPSARKKSSKPTLTKRNTKSLAKGLKFDMDTQYKRVLAGCLEKLPPINTRVVRIFLSSTFSGDIIIIYIKFSMLTVYFVSLGLKTVLLPFF